MASHVPTTGKKDTATIPCAFLLTVNWRVKRSPFAQKRIDETLKSDATDIFEKLGLDLSTAIRIFLTRSVQASGIPFDMTLQSLPYKSQTAATIMKEFAIASEKRGLSNMSLEEINAER